MDIIVNGTPRTTPAGLTLAELIDLVGLAQGSVVVEQNMDIIRPELFSTTPINEGDRIELIRFVGGG